MPLTARPKLQQWLALAGLSFLVGGGLELIRLPAALFLGPILAAIAIALCGAKIRMPGQLYLYGQGLTGCLIARGIPTSVPEPLIQRWPLFVAGVLAVILAATLLGWLLARWQVLPGSAAIWGTSPGAATAMVLMADAYGADARLVAVMQYLRVLATVAAASLVVHFVSGGAGGGLPAVEWFPPIDPSELAKTLGVAVSGSWLAQRLRIPAGPLMLPLLIGVILQSLGWMHVTLPPWLLVCGYAVIGWSIGLRFTRTILSHALKALPRILLSIIALMMAGGACAGLLVWLGGLDPLTAFLATSPGGADSVAIIANSAKVDLPFVMAMQTTRLILVLIASPRLARLVAGRMGFKEKAVS